MKILILSSDSEAPSHTSLSQELSTLGCEVALVDPKKTEWSLPKGQFKHSGKRIVKPDLVIPRFGYWNFEIGLRLLAGLQAVGCQSVNDWQSIFKANRKDFAAGIFTSLKVPIPQTWQFFLELDPEFPELIPPRSTVIFKALQGSQGKGVARTQSQIDQVAWNQFLRSTRTPFLTQEYLAGGEVRTLWFGKQCLGSIAKNKQGKEFRANLHLGGKAKATVLSPKEKSYCLKIMDGFNLDFAGIDFIRTKSGPSFLEVNVFPGFSMTSQALKINLAGVVAQQILAKFQKSST